MNTEYHSNGSCPKCGGDNEVKAEATISHQVSEASTTCTVCGYQGYWALGFFEIDDFEFRGKTYSF